MNNTQFYYISINSVDDLNSFNLLEIGVFAFVDANLKNNAQKRCLFYFELTIVMFFDTTGSSENISDVVLFDDVFLY